MTEQHKQVKVGDIVKTANGVQWAVDVITPTGILAHTTPASTSFTTSVIFIPWQLVVFPETPKAKPGVRYRMNAGIGWAYAIGLANGRLTGYVSASDSFLFTSDWIEVADE